MVAFTTYQTVGSLNFSNGTITTFWNYGNNVLMQGFLSPLFLALAFVVCYSMLAPTNFKEHAYTTSAFLVLMLSFAMTAAGVLSPYWLLLTMANMALGLYISARLNEVG